MSLNAPPPADQDPSLFTWTGSTFDYMSIQYYLAFTHTVFSVFGTIVNTLALAFFMANKSLRKSPSTLIIMSMLCADAFLALSFAVTTMGMVISSSWWYGKVGCGINAFLNLFGCAFSILTMVSMTLERYYAIVKGRPWGHVECYKAIAFVTFHSILTTAVPYIAQAASSTDLAYIARQPSGTYCTVAWWSNQPINIAFTIICALEIATCTNIMNFAYFKIYAKVRDVANEVQRNVHVSRVPSNVSAKTATSQTGRESKSLRSMERMILIKSVVTVVTFLGLWAPFDICVLYMAIGGKAISGVLDGVMICMIQLQHCLTPFIVVFMDTRCTKILWKYWKKVRGIEEFDESIDQSSSRTGASLKHSVANANTTNGPSLRVGTLRPEGAI